MEVGKEGLLRFLNCKFAAKFRYKDFFDRWVPVGIFINPQAFLPVANNKSG